MLIQTTEQILDYEGNPLPLSASADRPTTLRDVVQMALNNPLPNEEATKEQKAEWFRLTQLFYADATAEVSIADEAVIEDRVAALLTPIVYGRVHEIFARQSSISAVPDAADA